MLEPLPLVIMAPGFLTKVQFPVAGSPLRTTLPVETVHERLVMVPMTGADGMAFTVSV